MISTLMMEAGVESGKGGVSRVRLRYHFLLKLCVKLKTSSTNRSLLFTTDIFNNFYISVRAVKYGIFC